MDDGNTKKIAMTIFVIVLMLVGVLVGTLITRNLSTSTNTKTSASQTVVTPLEVLSPTPGQTVTQPIEIKARIDSTTEISKLNAVYKIGDTTAVPMRLEQSGSKLIMTAPLNPANSPKGRNTLSIYLYQTDKGSAELIGSAVFYISI